MDAQVPKGRLHRNRYDRIGFGVCSGLGDYFAIDPTLVRLAFVLITLAGGAGVLAYIILAMVMPEGGSEPLAGRDGLRRNLQQLRTTTGAMASGRHTNPDEPFSSAPVGRVSSQRRTNEFGAFILIAFGLVFLLGNLGWMRWFSWSYFWPVILIVFGLTALLQRANRTR